MPPRMSWHLVHTTPTTEGGQPIPECWICGGKGEIDELDYLMRCPACDVTWIGRATTKDGNLPKPGYDYMMWRNHEGEGERLDYVDHSRPGGPPSPG